MIVPNPRVSDSERRTGILYGVGVGPGDPDLLTIKAVNILKKVGIIAIPKSGEEAGSKALSIVGKAVDLKGKDIVELVLPMTKDKDVLLKARRDAALLLAEKLENGFDVACITIGDPLFYSTFSYLIPLVREKLPETPIDIISGVSSVMACAAVTVTPLAEADERLAVIPATYELEKLRNILRDFDTVVLMKVNKTMDKVLAVLEELDLKDNAAFVSRAGWPEEEVVMDLDSLRDKALDYFSMVIVKK
ncbi:MAG: precorrin-2 C(20)-methyltransferase [Deltaproteobacteria bacterium]|nr:precorrin-2 C(20)-methyltransferase [Deltaproteobacteria bacterium]